MEKSYEEKLKAKEIRLSTMEEISKHNSKENCWTVIRGKVYGLTQWIDEHLGGADKILSICGKDGTPSIYSKTRWQRKT
ncbi:MAG: cytochrome b5-like heme/steroid binding domain-containing protein [candidate division WOR-3 bacterium]